MDSITFIEDNKPKLLNIGIRDEVSQLRQKFFINCGVILDTKFSKTEKQNVCISNEIIKSVYYERDKNAAHKDTNYRPKKYATLIEMANDMKSQLNCVRQLCADVLPEGITLDFVPHDRKLFRQIHHITPEKEEQIKKLKHPMYGQIPKNADFFPPKRVLYDTEDIRRISENDKENYAVIIECGINTYEGIQNRQDGCIKLNVLYGENMWAHFALDGLTIYKRLRELGYYNEFDIIQYIPDDDPRWDEIVKLQIQV